MSDYFSVPDGEYFVDTTSKLIASPDKWHELSVNQLLEVQTELQNKAWTFRQHPIISSSLQRSLSKLQTLIQQKITA